MRVAVVGSGVAGLAAADALGREHDVDLFERGASLGGHVHTVSVPGASRDGRDLAVDMGFIVFNERRYPGLSALFAELGVRSRPTDMSFSVRREDTGFEFGTGGARALFARRRDALSPRHYRFLLEIARFTRLGRRALATPALAAALESLTLAEFLARDGVAGDVVDHFVVPLGAAIWSTSTARMMDFPAATYLRFCEAHGMLDLAGAPRWRTLVGGSATYVRALARRLRAAVHLETPVARVRREPAGVVLELASGASRRYDRCVLATHADEALALLADPSPAERRALGAIRSSRNTAVLHTDASFLPARPAARSAWNFHVPRPSARGDGVTVTYWMNRLQGLDAPEAYCVTLNPSREIPASRVVARAEFAHPLFDLAAVRAQREVPALQGKRGTYFCGAWQRYGFHEDGWASGREAARRLLADGDAPRRGDADPARAGENAT